MHVDKKKLGEVEQDLKEVQEHTRGLLEELEKLGLEKLVSSEMGNVLTTVASDKFNPGEMVERRNEGVNKKFMEMQKGVLDTTN